MEINDGEKVGMKLLCCIPAALSLFVAARPCWAQDSPLKGLSTVEVVVVWIGGPASDRDSLQVDIELKLRQCGIRVLTPTEQAVMGSPLLFVGVGGSTTTMPINVSLTETAYLAREMTRVPLMPPPRTVTTWSRYGAAQSAQQETVQEIIARYERIPQFQTPAGRAYLAPLLDHEVQSAIANAQRPASAGTVRDTVKSYVDAFLNDWLAANPKHQ